MSLINMKLQKAKAQEAENYLILQSILKTKNPNSRDVDFIKDALKNYLDYNFKVLGKTGLTIKIPNPFIFNESGSDLKIFAGYTFTRSNNSMDMYEVIDQRAKPSSLVNNNLLPKINLPASPKYFKHLDLVYNNILAQENLPLITQEENLINTELPKTQTGQEIKNSILNQVKNQERSKPKNNFDIYPNNNSLRDSVLNIEFNYRNALDYGEGARIRELQQIEAERQIQLERNRVEFIQNQQLISGIRDYRSMFETTWETETFNQAQIQAEQQNIFSQLEILSGILPDVDTSNKQIRDALIKVSEATGISVENLIGILSIDKLDDKNSINQAANNKAKQENQLEVYEAKKRELTFDED